MRYDKIVFGILVSSYCLFGANTLVNGSFEQPLIGDEPPNHVKSWANGTIVTYYDSDVNGWETTATDHEIEFWSAAAGNPFEGNQFIELNANQVAAVYQDVPTIPGKKFNWFVAHRGRSGVDTARVLIGPPDGPLQEVKTMIDDNDAWGTYLGSYEVPSGQTVTRLQFEAVSTASGNDTIGNFLDAFKVGPVMQYKMDECYWLGSGTYDVYDSSLNGADGEALNGAQITKDDAIINNAGSFDGSDDYISVDDDGALDLNQTFTLAMWLKPSSDDSAVLIDHSHKTSSRFGTTTIDKGWLLSYQASSRMSSEKLSFEMVIDGTLESVEVEPDSWKDQWHFVSVVYDGSELRLRVDDINNTTSNLSGSIDNASSSLLCIASSQGGGDYYSGLIDEVKIFAVALGDDEIATLKANDLAGNNYTGVARDSVVCDASITGHTWELVGIPADFRNSSNTKTTIEDIFDDDMSGSYGTDWRVYRREYNVTDNNSSYVYMDIKDELKFGVGYWLGSKLDSTWSENGAVSVDYNSSTNGTNDCPAERCVEIPMTSVALDEAVDDLNNSGPYRYFMTGFIGKQPINWSDCRLIVSDLDGSNQEILTPSDADSAGYMYKQIWQYNPSNSKSEAKGYTTCDDVTPGSCKLIPYKGFWVELHGKTKDKTVKLLIPKG
jgi:hypothetical protein